MTFDAATLLAQLGQNASGNKTDPVLRALIAALGQGVSLQSTAPDFWPDPFGATPKPTDLTASDIVGFEESVQDIVIDMLVAGTNVTLSLDRATNRITVSSTGGGAGVASGALVRLDGGTLGAAAPTVPITIPVGYRDFEITGDGRGDTAVNNYTRLRLRLNGDSTAGNYDWMRQNAHDSGLERESDGSLINTAFDIGILPSATGPASYRGRARVVVSDYLNATLYKAVKFDFTGPAVGEYYTSEGGGNYKSTSPIASATLLTDNGNLLAGFKWTLYGIAE
jgi:hypothetical protein